MHVKFGFACAATALALAFAAASPTMAAAEDFYKGKTLVVVVGSATGGAYDHYARVLARYITRYIPGSPTAVVQNMPGAGSVTAARYLDTNAPKDGTVIVSFNSTLITSSLTKPEMVKMKFTDVAWIGAMTHEFRVCYAWAQSGFRNWNDLAHAKKEFIVGATGTGTAAYVNGAVLHNLLGINIRQVLGYTGAAQQRLAIERGELEGGCSEWNALPLNWVNDKKVYPLVRWLKEKPEGFDYSDADVPYIADKAPNAEARAIIDLLGAPGELGNPFIASNKVPADRLKILRAAFDKMVKDPELKAELKKAHQPLEPTSWAEAEKITAEIYKSATPDLVAKAKEAMK